MALLENDGSGIEQLIRSAEADIERIQFAVLREEQRPAAIFRLDELRDALAVKGGADAG